MSEGYYLTPELYDIVYSDYVADVAPHVESAKEARGPVLEVCCGNGRLMLPTLAAGVDCDGLDLDPEMLADLRRKLEQRKLRANLYAADMREFTLPRRYALVAVPFNSFLHNLSQTDQLATLRCCRQHLEVGGRLQLTTFHPSVEKLHLWASGEHLMKEIPAGAHRVRVFDAATDDRVEQVRHMTRRVEFLDDTGVVEREVSVSFSLRYIFKPEMELLLRAAGFARFTVRPLFADYTATETYAAERPIREGDVLSWTAWKE